MTLRHGSLCTGFGGLDLAAQTVLGGELAWWSDIEPGPIKVMQHHHPSVPNLGDLRTVDWPTVPTVDILTAGFPCQPFSNAGKRLGTRDPRHLWPHIADAIGVLRPGLVLLENVPGHLRRGFDTVSAQLAGMGYRLAWGIVSAAEVGAPHLRKRLFVVAEDTDRPASDKRWLTASRQEARGGHGPTLADEVEWTLADPARQLHHRPRPPGTGGRHEPPDSGEPTDGEGDEPCPLTLLPTPTANAYGNNQGGAAGRVGPIRPSLNSLAPSLPATDELALLPTPKATDGYKGGPNMRGSSGDPMLPMVAVTLLPTPTARDWKSGTGVRAENSRPLNEAATKIGESTPTQSDAGKKSSPPQPPTRP